MSLECLVRKEKIKATPEEKVRQGLIAFMIDSLGYPKSSFALEKELELLPHLEGKKVPKRRADLLIFAPNIHPKHVLYPLLLIECKAVKLNAKVLSQVTGYNAYVQAPFVAVANETEVKTGWIKGKEYTFIDGLPSYKELIDSIRPKE